MVAMDEAGEAASSDEVVFTQILSLLKFDAGVVRVLGIPIVSDPQMNYKRSRSVPGRPPGSQLLVQTLAGLLAPPARPVLPRCRRATPQGGAGVDPERVISGPSLRESTV